MSQLLHEDRAVRLQTPARQRPQILYWVIGGCYGDDSRSWRRWSEVVGPYTERSLAKAQQERLLAIFANDPRVHFEVAESEAAASEA